MILLWFGGREGRTFPPNLIVLLASPLVDGASCVYEFGFIMVELKGYLVPLLFLVKASHSLFPQMPKMEQYWGPYWCLQPPKSSSNGRCSHLAQEFFHQWLWWSRSRQFWGWFLERFWLGWSHWYWQSHGCRSQFLSPISISIIVSAILVIPMNLFTYIMHICICICIYIYLCTFYYCCRNIVVKDSANVQLQQRILGKGLVLLQLWLFCYIYTHTRTYVYLSHLAYKPWLYTNE